MHNLVELIVWGRKSKAYKNLMSDKPRKTVKKYLVLNERAMLRLSGKLFAELPRDIAISVLNAIKQCAK